MSIVIKNLTKVYSNGFKALDDVSFEIPSNQIFGLLGANGAGKTTLLGILSGLLNKTSGDIIVDGVSIDQDHNSIKMKFGIVPQEFNFNIFEKCSDIVLNQAGLYGIPRDQVIERMNYLFTNLGLADKADQPSQKLSGGMKRRLMIARALIHKPQILILDEPTAGVDVELRKEMWEFLERLQKEENTTVILTTHYLEEVEKLCTNLSILAKGKLVKEGDVKTLIGDLARDEYIINTDKEVNSTEYNVTKNDGNGYKVSLSKGQTLNDLVAFLTKSNIKLISISPESSPVEQLFLQTINTKSDLTKA